MPRPFQPRLDILPAAQRRLWPELIDVAKCFTLYGGTAIALRLAHRQSVDFAFFGREQFDPDALYRGAPFLRDADVLQKTGDTLTCLLQREGPVRVSFFALPGFPEIADPDVAPQIGLKMPRTTILSRLTAHSTAELIHMSQAAVSASERLNLRSEEAYPKWDRPHPDELSRQVRP